MTTAKTPISRNAYILALFLLLALPAVVPAQWAAPTSGSPDITNTNTTGNVGVGTGTSAPAGKLDVKGSTSDTSAAALTVRNSSDTNLFFVRNDGRVGMGTTSPLAFFHVARADAVTGAVAFFQKDTSSNGVILGTNNSKAFLSGVNSNLTVMTDLLLNPFGGNIGIGTLTPSARLHVQGGNVFHQYSTTAGQEYGFYTAINNNHFTSNLVFDGQWKTLAAGKGALANVGPASGFAFAVYADNTSRAAGAIASPTQYFTVAMDGNVGVGTPTPPVFKLDVAGQVRSSSGGFVFPNGTVQTTAATMTGVTAGTGLTGGGSSGSVTLNVAAGIGITAGAGGVSVNYGSTAGTAVQGNTTLTVTAGTGMSGGGSATLGSGGTITLNNSDPGSSQFIFKNVGNAAGAAQFSAGSNTDTLRFEGTGGTTVSFDGVNKKVVINSSAASSGWTDGGAVVNLTSLTAKVGIGTPNPTTALEVGRNASGAPSGLTLTGGSTVAAPILYFNYADAGTNLKRWGVLSDINGGFSIGTQPDAGGLMSQKLFISNAGNVGVGTTAPLQRLQLGSNTVTGTATPDAISLGATYSTAVGTNAKLRLLDDGNQSVYGLGVSASQFDFIVPTGARYVWNISGAEKMRLDTSGNLGIGTTPGAGYKLDVNGDAHVTGAISTTGAINAGGAITGATVNATYQDVAEWVPSTQKLSAGTVVVLDKSETNHVLASTRAYDTKVAGVVSVEPGVILGVAGEGKLKVATTGRVRVKVDATRAPVEVGDLLVTSDVEGVAMKSVEVDLGGVKIHRPGTIIGKALEPLASGTGEILVLLSLQ